MQERYAGSRTRCRGRGEIVDAAQALDAARSERRAQHAVRRKEERGELARGEPQRIGIAARVGAVVRGAHLPSISRAIATTASGSKPNFFCSSFNGADAPNVCMPTTRPRGPT